MVPATPASLVKLSAIAAGVRIGAVVSIPIRDQVPLEMTSESGRR